jgi:type IV pilus assembly protein PilB
MIQRRLLQKIIEKQNILPSGEIKKLFGEAKTKNQALENLLFEKKIISPRMLYQKAAEYFKLPFVDLRDKKIDKKLWETLPLNLIEAHNTILIEDNRSYAVLATANPGDLEIFEFITKKLNKKINIFVASPDEISSLIRANQKTLSFASNDLEKDLYPELENDSPTKTINKIIEYAMQEGSSDIHFEPEENDIIIRYRIDGILHEVMHLPKKGQNSLTSRIKIMSNLKVDEHRMPQDGRFKFQAGGNKISIRISTIPSMEGEKIVMRLLNEKTRLLSLEQLGAQTETLEKIKTNIKKSRGLILVTGPTGSGKTTTLYTIIGLLNRPEVNISTIEDPVEYRIPKINQSQINTKIGFTFATGLRAFLRQDPDIIMVGEIRDKETAEIAIHAGLTGHLVLSTLHTNDAVSSIFRLIDMGVPRFLLSATASLIIAQRLVRKICPHCIQSFNLDSKTVKELERDLDTKKIIAVLTKKKIIASTDSKLQSMLFYRGTGCEKCNHTGYKGRIGIYEALEVSPAVAELISQGAELSEIKKYVETDDWISMVDDGFIKAKNGITTIEELLRVANE